MSNEPLASVLPALTLAKQAASKISQRGSHVRHCGWPEFRLSFPMSSPPASAPPPPPPPPSPATTSPVRLRPAAPCCQGAAPPCCWGLPAAACPAEAARVEPPPPLPPFPARPVLLRPPWRVCQLGRCPVPPPPPCCARGKPCHCPTAPATTPLFT